MVVAGIGVTLIPELARRGDSMRYIPFAGNAEPTHWPGVAQYVDAGAFTGPLATVRRAVGSLGPEDRAVLLEGLAPWEWSAAGGPLGVR